MGTSITDESLDTDELKLLLDAHVEKMISYTILRKDGKVDPAKCLEESVKIVKKEIFNVVVVQQGTNEVSNAKKGEGSEKFKAKFFQLCSLKFDSRGIKHGNIFDTYTLAYYFFTPN